MSTIDELEKKDERTAAQLDDAPFPEAGPIPTATVDLEEAAGEPDAFGDAESAAPLGVEDATLEAPSDKVKIPVTYVEAAEAVGQGDAGNELDSPAIVEWHKANDTSAEALSIQPNESSAKSDAVEVADKPARRGRRTNAEIAAAKAAAEAAAAAE